MVSTKQVAGNFCVISVIVPCYNQAIYLPEALDSVQSQTYQNWECIIVNDGSDDDTETIALAYTQKDNRFRYLRKENGGLSSARNAGIKNATGTYILPLDADDRIGNQYLELGMQAFKEIDNLKLVYCMANKFGSENGIWSLKTYSYKNILIENCIFCSALFKKSDWELAGGYDESLLHGWEDWMFWLKILDEDALVYQIPLVLFFYRTKLASMITAMTQDYMEMVRWKAFESNMPAYKKNFNAPQTLTVSNLIYAEINQKAFNSYSYKLGNAFIKPLSYLKQLSTKTRKKAN